MILPDNPSQVCCFTGHRDISPEKEALLSPLLTLTLRNLLLDRGFTDYLCGGAVGFDMIAAEHFLSLRDQYHTGKLHLLLPFPGYDDRWPTEARERLRILMDRADSVLYAADHSFPGVYYKRDRMLVNLSSLCVAYLTRSRGGTYYTVSYAYDAKKEIINLAKLPQMGIY